MKSAFAHFHREQMNRRDALKFGAAGAAAAVAAATVGARPAAAQGNGGGSNGSGAGQQNAQSPGRYGPGSGSYSDEMFDVDAVLAGAWDDSRYGPGDQRGTLNEITAQKTAEAGRLLAGNSVKSYQLGESMYNGFPAFPSEPPRLHDMFLYVFGYQAPPGFVEGGGIQSGTTPLGPNLVTGHEERFAQNFTFQIGTQVDGLNHIGVGEVYYNGFRGPDIATPTGTSALGNETMGPIATRGVIYDVVGLKVEQGQSDAYFMAPNGQPVLIDNYRITLDDLRGCLERQGVAEIGAGDVPILHTGWTHLARTDPGRYLTQEPGIFLEEARYFADRRVALVASDTWGVEVLDPAVTGGNAFPVHQELIVGNGIRLGESFVTDSAIADGVYEGMLVVTPENVPGATCGSTPPVLLA